MRTIITIALLCTLAACGGGGDGESIHDRDTQPVNCSASAPNCI
jgi:hypothetical protein